MTKQRERLVINNLSLAAIIAGRVASRLPRGVDQADLVQEARIGLMDAATRYRAGRGVKFTTFARRRVTGQVLDYLRDLDYLSRDARRRVKAAEAAGIEVAAPQQQPPESLEHPDWLPGALDDPDQCARELECRRLLAAAIGTLPARLQHVVWARYYQGKLLREIGGELGVNESRASQLHSRAVGLMRGYFARRGERL